MARATATRGSVNVRSIRTAEQIQQLFHERISSKVQLTAVGNSKRKLRDVAVDLINASDMSWQTIAEGTFLTAMTVKRLAQDITKNPQAETIERVFRFFSYEVALSATEIKTSYANKHK